jgi:hypothetical protein
MTAPVAALATWNSSTFARPSQIGAQCDLPSYSTHSLDPLRGFVSLRRWIVHEPCAKSKSCWPSRTATALDRSFAMH